MPARPNMTLAVKRLIRDVARRVPALSHVRPSRVLVVAGEARRASRATIRGVEPGAGRPEIAVKGRHIRYVITLRPLWFLDSTPEERVATVLHELYHAATAFDGALHRGRRHRELGRGAYSRRIRALLDDYLARAPAALLSPFAFSGVARARMWLERPTARATRAGRTLYSEKQLFHGPVTMRTRGERRRGPRKRVRGLDEEEWG